MVRSLAVASLLLCVAPACIHSGSRGAADLDGTSSDEVANEGLPSLADLDVEDPDPDADAANTPQFCNPNGKSGGELAKCYEQNEGVYSRFNDEAKQREPWFNFAPGSWLSSHEVEPRYIMQVVQVQAAIDKLSSTPDVPLTPAQLKYYTGRSVSYPGMTPYLVRGLLYYRTGRFTVLEKNDAIYVRHDSAGDATPPESRAPIVVFLAFQPKAVYVDCELGG